MLYFIWKKHSLQWLIQQWKNHKVWLIDRKHWLIGTYKILVPYPLNMYEVGRPNPKGGWCFPLATKIPQVFHRSGKVFLIWEKFPPKIVRGTLNTVKKPGFFLGKNIIWMFNIYWSKKNATNMFFNTSQPFNCWKIFTKILLFKIGKELNLFRNYFLPDRLLYLSVFFK
jgi:hypothetical protein